MNNPIQLLTDKERDTFSRFLKVMVATSEEQSLSPEDMAFVTNNAQPMADSLIKAISKWAASHGMVEDEVGSMLTFLNKLAHIAGGINFADYAVTESIAKNMEN